MYGRGKNSTSIDYGAYLTQSEMAELQAPDMSWLRLVHGIR